MDMTQKQLAAFWAADERGQAVNRKRHNRIMFWDDERKDGNRLMVTLQNGFSFEQPRFGSEHVRGFDTIKEAMAAIRGSYPCDCARCTGKAGE